MIELRFVSYSDIVGDLISADEQGSPWDHVEAVMPDGSGYLGAVEPDGVKIRPVGYDKPFVKELFVDLPATDAITNAFYSYLKSRIGTPYDFAAIAGFALKANMHQKDHVICSALQTLGLVKSAFFPGPLSRPAHEVDPSDLLLVLSSHVLIPGAN
jgi:hypothetical protein